MNEELYQEQGISFSDIFFLIKRNILLILIVTILSVLAGGIYAFGIKKPVYSAEATAVVQAEPNSTNVNEATSYSYSVALANTFNKIIKSITVINEAADQLIEAKEYTEEQRTSLKNKLKNNVSVSSDTSSLMLTLTAKSVDPEEAILLVNALLKATITVVDQHAVDENGVEIPDEYNYIILANKLKVLSEASIETTVQKSNKLIIVVVACMIGVIISFGIILIKYLSDDTYTSKDAFEKTFNINILSSIQNIEGGN